MLALKLYKLNRCKCGKAPKMSIKQSIIAVNLSVTCKCGWIHTLEVIGDTQEALDTATDKMVNSLYGGGARGGIY